MRALSVKKFLGFFVEVKNDYKDFASFYENAY